MAFWDSWFKPKQEDVLTEAIGSFKNKGEGNLTDKQIKNTRGEGYSYDEFYAVMGYGKESMQSFNTFHSTYIDNIFANQIARLNYYRMMAEMPEIASVIEDIVVESTQENQWGQVVEIDILDPEITKNENIVNNITDEFDSLFFKKMSINNIIFDFIRSYFVDGKLYLEKVTNASKPSVGIIGLKKLPCETMDSFVDPKTGRITGYVQYLNLQGKRVQSREEAEKEKNCVIFEPEQIIYLDYGIYGRTKKEVIGYLEKAKQPFNQLKLLETSVVIYRLVRAPERLVFKIDTGSMPLDKSMKFVEKIRQKMTQRVGYNKTTGKLENQPDVISMLDNYFLPQCISLNTEISCLDGDKTLQQMIDDYNNGIKNEVLSVDQKTGELIHGEVEWAGITRRDAELVRVHLDNGKHVDVTPDHKFVMRDGTEVEAQQLVSGSSLMPYYTREKEISYNSNTYKQVYDLKDGKWKFVHRIVYGTSSGVIHHKDFNRYNNMKDNLTEMDTYGEFKNNVIVNHKVVSVEILPFREDTGCLTIKDAGNNHNFPLTIGVFVKNSADGRGSDVSSVGGNASGFKELDDIYYFARKLYMALKYPMSRIMNIQEGRNADNVWFQGQTGQISRDEIRWSKFLERHQNKFEQAFLDLFLLHLEFKGLKAEYELDRTKINILMVPPNNYKQQMAQLLLDTQLANYSSLRGHEEFSKYFLMKEYLNWDDDMIKANSDGFKKDDELFPKSEF